MNVENHKLVHMHIHSIQQKAFRVARKKLKDPGELEDCEEIANECVVQLLKLKAPIQNIEAMTFVITRRLVADYQRKRVRHRNYEHEQKLVSSNREPNDPARVLEDLEFREQYRDYLLQLSIEESAHLVAHALRIPMRALAALMTEMGIGEAATYYRRNTIAIEAAKALSRA